MFRLLLGLCLVGVAGGVWAEEPRAFVAHEAKPLVSPALDDAALHDVCLIGENVGFAVGDYGVVLKTDDGGQHWEMLGSITSGTLTSVCFLTDQIGWVAGKKLSPFGQAGKGMVFQTRDGGKSFQQLPRTQLPPLEKVQFFDLERGIAVGEASSQYPSGVMYTLDGGQTWLPKTGMKGTNWKSAAFNNIQLGLVGGTLGTLANVRQDEMSPSSFNQFDLRTVHDITMNHLGQGWMAGEGGFLFHTTNHGVNWNAPEDHLLNQIRDIQDFHSVAMAGTHVWAAGSPGTVIWHSPDQGQTWERQATPQNIPIYQIDFVTPQQGVAVGALGSILHTRDGGETWNEVRANHRRVALMNLATSAEKIAFPLLARESGELGYRSLVYLPVRTDVPQYQFTGKASPEFQAHSAVKSVQGNVAISAWQFPLTRPDLELSESGLREDLNEWSDGRFAEILERSLVSLIRTWRPSMVVMSETDSQDEITRLFNSALHKAIQQASDPTLHPEQLEVLGLIPWQVERVLHQKPEGVIGPVEIDPFQFLLRKKQTIHHLVASAYQQVGVTEPVKSHPGYYELVYDHLSESVDSQSRSTTNSSQLWGGLRLTPGSEARRVLEEISPEDLAREQEIAKRQKQLAGIGKQYLHQPEKARQILSHMKQYTRGFSSSQSARQLVQLAQEFQRKGFLKEEEVVLTELFNRYPHEQVNVQVAERLFLLWSSGELAWLRSQEAPASSQAVNRSVKSAQRNLIQQANALRGTRSPLAPPLQLKGNPEDFAPRKLEGDLKVGPTQDWRSEKVKNWHRQALKMAMFLQKSYPETFHSPEIQFPLFNLLQHAPKSVKRQFQQAEAANVLSLSEMMLSSTSSGADCLPTSEKPHLDGLLSDECWIQAKEIKLTAPDEINVSLENYPFVLTTHDEDYFYLAASFPKHPKAPETEVILPGRKHDGVRKGFDRLTVCIDLDRDYHTYYELQFDQRGEVSEKCWGDSRWNPKMYVATAADETHWRIEVAIPARELTPQKLSGQTWSVAAFRTIPAVGLQSWSHPVSATVPPGAFGSLRIR